MYSQNKEEEIILQYYPHWFKGTVLDIGANDGKTLSNSRALIERGWHAALIEPDPVAFRKLWDLYVHSQNQCVCWQIAIGKEGEEGFETFYSSGTHLNKGDTGLLSSLKKEELARFPGTEFEETTVQVKSIRSLFDELPYKTFDAVLIDAEGMDLDILTQIDLKDTATSLVCVEYNGKDEYKYGYYCQKFGMKLIHKNAENLIYGL